MRVASSGRKEALELLINYGANINARSNYGETALMCAACNGKKEALELLINYGAEIMARSNYGRTALMWAIETNISKECTKLLIEAKSDLLEFFDLIENNPKIDFLNCIPSGVVMTETQIKDLHALGIREEDLSSNGVVSFELNIIRASKVLCLYANKDIVAEIISYTINDCRIKLLYSILYEKVTKMGLFLMNKAETKKKPKAISYFNGFF